MKKFSKYLLALGASAVFFAGCQNESAIENENKWGRDPVSLSNAKSTDLVKINIKDVKGFGTIWGGNAATTKTQARTAAGENNGSNTLIAFKADGTTDYALTKPEGLAAWCEYQPVREVYQCPYSNVAAQAKGIYVVFSSYIDFWEDEAGNKLAPIGQLMYVKPDGTVIDIFGSNNKAKTVLDTTIKENDDWDYIKFDEQGNIYMIVNDEGVSKLCRYKPQTDELTFYNNIPGEKIHPLNFEVTSNGAYIILNTLVNYEGRKTIDVLGGKEIGTEKAAIETGKNYVYAIPANSTADVQVLYESKAENGGREIHNVCYDSTTNTVYFGVESLYASYVGSGLHVWNWNKTKGQFDKERIFFNVQNYMWRDKEKRDVNYVSVYNECKNNSDKEKGAQDFLDYLKSFYGANADKVHFTLDFWRNYQNATNLEDGKSAPWDMPALDMDDVENTTNYYFQNAWNPYDILYKTDEAAENPKVLTDYAAMRYLMTTDLETFRSTSEKNYNIDYLVDNDTLKNLKGGANIWDLCTYILFDWGIAGFNATWPEGYNDYEHCNYAFKTPLWLFFTTAEDGTWSAETAAYPGYYNLNDADEKEDARKWCFSSANDLAASYLITNDDGVWAIHDGCDNWDLTGWQEDYAQITKLFKADGRFSLEKPDSVKDIEAYKLPHLWPDGDVRNRIDSDPWYKAPFKSFTDGLLLKDRNNSTIWYYDCTDHSCSKIFDDSSLSIYSYSLNNKVLTVNGNTDLGYNRTVKVNIASGKKTEIESDAKFETLIDVNIPAEN